MEDLQTKKNKAVIRYLYEDALNSRRLDLLHELIADDYTGIRGEKGVEGFSETVGSIIAGFPDIKWTIEDLLGEDDKITVRWSWKGTHLNAFRGILPSNKVVNDNAIVIYQLKDGKIVQAWLQGDRLGFLVQVGVIPKELLPSPPLPPAQTSGPTPGLSPAPTSASQSKTN